MYFVGFDGKGTVRVAKNRGQELMMYGKSTWDEWEKETDKEKVDYWEMTARRFLEQGHYHHPEPKRRKKK